MSVTQAAAVIDALVGALADIPGVKVFDGQPFKLDAQDVLVVGFSAARPAAEITQRKAGLRARAESVSIVCLASALRGNTVMPVVRARAIEILDAAEAVLDADRTLGDLVTTAEIGYELVLDEAQTKEGATATVEFTVLATLL